MMAKDTAGPQPPALLPARAAHGPLRSRKLDALGRADNPAGRGVAALVGLLLLWTVVAPASAQTRDGELSAAASGRGAAQPRETASQEPASPFLAPSHWANAALGKLDALGLLPRGYDQGWRSMPRLEAAGLLAEAAARAEAEDSSVRELARGYAARFAEEFPAASGAAAGAARSGIEAALSAGFESREGELLAGYGNEEDTWTGPSAAEDVAGPAASVRWAGMLTPYLAAELSGGRTRGDWSVPEVYAVARWRGLGLWGGRRAPGFGTGAGGNVVLAGSVPLTGVGLFLASPAGLPGFLESLGPLRFELFVSRFDRNGPWVRPWFAATRVGLMPHPRVALGASRGAIFSGENGEPVDLENFLFLLIGKHGRGGTFENQVAAVDARYLPPLPWPIALSIEWGIEDSAGALFDTPAVIARVELAAVPGLPAMALAVERASFARSCCGNPIWYRHQHFLDGWTMDDVPLGHPLGGHGREWLGLARADLLEARLRGELRLFARERGEENLYAPDREGTSAGAAVRLDWRATAQTELFLDGRLEDGLGWTERRIAAGGRLLF